LSSRVSDDLIEEIRASNDIVGLISEYLPLKKQGKNYVGLCPFHEEKKPSFSVSPQRQIFHCFGCGMGGNIFKFLMEYQKMGFLDAVKHLAERANIAVPERDRDSAARSEYEPLYKANHLAAAHYHQQLLKNVDAEKARRYLKQRGFTDRLIQTFRLGYAPPGWDGLIKRAARRSISPELLARAGLILKRDFGEGYYDRFRDRLIFPINNISGKFIAFGGRTLEDSDEVKYINSPETAIYQKGRTLYGLFQNKEAIRKAGEVVVVEGFTDLLSLHQAGIDNVVASLGTALTAHQARLLARYAQEAIILYDADSAGIAAAQRGIDLLLEAGLVARVASLPKGMDPDQVVREKGGEHLAERLKNAGSFLEFKLHHVLEQRDVSSVSGKAQAIEEMGRTLSLVDDPIKRGLFLKEVAERMDVDEKLVALAVDKASARPWRKPKSEAGVEEVVHAGGELLERKILALLLQYPEMLPNIRERLCVKDFDNERHRRIVERLLAAGEGGVKEPANLINALGNNGLESLVSELCFLEEEGQIDRLLEDSMRKLEEKRLLREERRLKEQLRDAEKQEDQSLIDQLTRKLSEIAQQRYNSTSARQ
jgi:DNA primase